MISESQSYSDFGDEDFVGSLLQQATPDQYTNSSSKEQQQKNQMGRRKHCAKKKTRKEKITCENKRMNTNQLEERKPKKQKLNQGDHVPSNKRIFNEQTRIRNSPKWLTLALAALSKDQKKWVIDAGFGSLLKFGIKELPHKLGYFLLTKFDEKNSVLHLPNGDLEVLESDVHDVLGFPHGRLHLELSNQKKNLVDWQDQFPEEKRKKITAKMVSEEIVKTTEVTTLFKYNFLLLLYNTFIKCISHPSICQDMLTFTDIDRTSQYNWCEAVLLNLQQQTTIWKEDPSTKYFNGALVFITLQYVDRVMHNNERVIPRGEPTLIGWTDELLHARQTNESKLGVYGSGVIDHTIRDEMRNRQSIKSKLRMPQLDDEEETESTQPNFKNLKRKLKKAASILKRSKKKFDNILLKCKIRDASDESVKRIERKVSKLFNAQKNNVYQDMPLESDAAMQDTGENHSQEFIGKKDGEEEKGIEAKSNSSGEDRVDQQKDGNEIYSHRNNITKQYQRKSKQTSQSNGDKVSVPKDKNDNSEHWEQRTTEQGQNSTPKEAKKNTGVHPHNEKVQILPLVSQEITSSFLSELSRAIKEQENYTRRGLQFTAEETEKNTPRAITPDGQTLHNTPSSIETVRLGSETDISKDICNKDNENVSNINNLGTIQKQNNFSLDDWSTPDIDVDHIVQQYQLNAKAKEIPILPKKCMSQLQEPCWTLCPSLETTQTQELEANSKCSDVDQSVREYQSNPKSEEVPIQPQKYKPQLQEPCWTLCPSLETSSNQEHETNAKQKDVDQIAQDYQLNPNPKKVPIQPKGCTPQLEQLENEDNIDVVEIAHQNIVAAEASDPEHDDQHTKGNDKEAERKNKRQTRKTMPYRSPFLDRVTDLNPRIKPNEQNIWNWLFESNVDPNAPIFEWGDMKATMEQMQSFELQTEIMTGALDCWTYILNKKEDDRAPESPYRFFFPTSTLIGTLHHQDGGGGKEERSNRFFEHMDDIKKIYPDFDILKYHLIFFPIISKRHFYTISYNLKKPAMYLIDNRCTNPGLKIYDKRPDNLHGNFSAYLHMIDHPKSAEIRRIQKPKRMQMHWRTKHNALDCGIFTMRHLETYMGETEEWDSGLTYESDAQKRQIKTLRVRYCYKILMSALNSKKDSIHSLAIQHAQKKKQGTALEKAFDEAYKE